MPEPTARRLKNEYWIRLKEIRSRRSDGKAAYVSSLPTLQQGRPLLLGNVLNSAVQDYIKAMREVGGVVTTAIVMAAAEGIVAARDESLLVLHGEHIEITKSWPKSLLLRMKYEVLQCRKGIYTTFKVDSRTLCC